MKQVLLALCLTLAGCASLPFIGISRKEKEYPAVGVLYNFGLMPTCTVTLIDEQVVLTAAHCITNGLLFAPTVSFDGETHYEVPGGWLHDEWEGEGDWSDDIALLDLAEAPPIKPMPISDTPLGVDQWGETIVAVGRADETYRVEERWLVGKMEGTDLLMWPDPNDFLINGDSGGPLIWDGKVIGVNVMGMWEEDDDEQCVWNVSLSTDVGEHIDWISDTLGWEPEPDPE